MAGKKEWKKCEMRRVEMKRYVCGKCLGPALPCVLTVSASSRPPTSCPMPSNDKEDVRLYYAEWVEITIDEESGDEKQG